MYFTLKGNIFKVIKVLEYTQTLYSRSKIHKIDWSINSSSKSFCMGLSAEHTFMTLNECNFPQLWTTNSSFCKTSQQPLFKISSHIKMDETIFLNAITKGHPSHIWVKMEKI